MFALPSARSEWRGSDRSSSLLDGRPAVVGRVARCDATQPPRRHPPRAETKSPADLYTQGIGRTKNLKREPEMTQKTDNEENSTNSQVRRTKTTDEYDEANGAKKKLKQKGGKSEARA